MSLPEPTFDSRKYREILNEAMARVGSHNPEWTNLNDSDPGVTLLQLFAFMSESIIYRANLIPDRNRRKFLHLLGIPPAAAAAAEGLVAFSNPKGLLKRILLEADQEVLAGNVPFRTENALDVLPIEARVYYKAPLSAARRAEVEKLYKRLYPDVVNPDFYETSTFETPQNGVSLPTLELSRGPSPNPQVLDGAVWLALLALPREDVEATRLELAGGVLSLGVMPALDAYGKVLSPSGSSGDAPSLIYELPDTTTTEARYRRLQARGGHDVTERPGVVEIPLPEADQLHTWDDFDPMEEGLGDYPPTLAESDDRERLVTWLRIRLPESGNQGSSTQLKVRLSWIGINAARVVQRTRVVGEMLPQGTGEPDQTARLVNTPVIPSSVELTVDGEVWERIDDLLAAGPEVPPQGPRMASEGEDVEEKNVFVYTVDRESGEIRFGDGFRGMRPPRGAAIRASYDHGGGRQGMVGIGAIKKGLLPSGVQVTNAVPTWGGDEAETIADAERRIPATLRHRERLVTAADIDEITWRTPGVDLGRVEVLPLFDPDAPGSVSPGTVTVFVLPRFDPQQPDAPRPDRLFLETVCRYLEPRRVLTTALHIRGPEYVEMSVTVGVDLVPGRDAAPVLENVRQAVRDFLSPLTGGFEKKGWPLGTTVEKAEVAAAATRVDGVAHVTEIRLGDDKGNERSTIPLSGLRLPRLVALGVEEGSAPTLEELRGGGPTPGAAAVAVPVIPEEC